MCMVAALSALGVGGATAAGATAGAASALSGLGTALAVGGSLIQAVNTYQTGRANAQAIEDQKAHEQALNAAEDQRERAQFKRATAQQRAEITGRGLNLDSPTAIFLGQTAAREMSFQSQSTRSRGQARQTELTASARNWRARATKGLLKGTFSAAGTVLNRRVEQWAGMPA